VTLPPPYVESVLYSFDGTSGGATNPDAGVLAASDGNFYGSTLMAESMAFHEKAGRSQVDFCGSWNIVVLPPRGRCRHASIRTLEERLVSLGACWAFSVQPVLPSVWRPVVLLLQSGTWARPLTQSPELGFGLCLFSSLERF
jgi:hypothetical protein